MDDLKLLSEMRADAPEPDAERLRAARSRFHGGASRRRGLPYRLGLRLMAAAALAVAVAFAVVTVRTGGEEPPRVRTDPAAVLERAALAAESRRTGPPPRPDQWVHEKYLQRQPDEAAAKAHEQWIRYDGRRQAYREDNGTISTTAMTPDPKDDDLTPQEYAAKLAKLPTDPAELLAHIKGDAHWGVAGDGETPDARAFRVLSVYLEEQPFMPPKLEAAIFRAFALIPGVTAQEGVRDAAERPGVGFAYEPGDQRDAEGRPVARTYIVISADTYHYLGRRVQWLRNELIDGAVAFRAGSSYADATLLTEIVDTAPSP
ncbi:CU044_5270 family protein [Nonomuraea sp. NPDC050556]|uniref:CU044_5270 family protein n=1 Tax=Nonomuraea sp. NPDC050556 TaxID=3364369 RepID=UPI00378A24DB